MVNGSANKFTNKQHCCNYPGFAIVVIKTHLYILYNKIIQTFPWRLPDSGGVQ